MQDDDRRQFKRVPLSQRVRFRKLQSTKEGFLESSPEAANISVGGIFIPTRTPMPKGSAIEIEWYLPSRNEKVAILGVVQWVGENEEGVTGMGIKFIKLDSQVRDDIIRISMRGQWQDAQDQKRPPAGRPPETH